MSLAIYIREDLCIYESLVRMEKNLYGVNIHILQREKKTHKYTCTYAPTFHCFIYFDVSFARQ